MKTDYLCGKLKKYIRLILLLTALSLAVSGNASAAGEANFRTAVADTSIRLLRFCLKGNEKKNVLISPDSILTAMSMVESGASGKTLTEMKKALGGIPAASYKRSITALNRRITGQGKSVYRIANSVWYRKNLMTLKPSYLQELRAVYRAESYAEPFDSSTVRNMNDWVSRKTEGKIKSIADRRSSASRLVLMNAVYFRGDWKEPYTSAEQRTFRKANGQKQKVSMVEGTEHEYVTLAGGTGFVKDYAGGKLAFMAVLPPKGMSVSRYLKKLNGKDYIRAYKKRKKSGVSVRTRMPEFRYEYSRSLKAPLRKLGIRRAFTGAAQFSGMTSAKICIDDIIHKTYIDVNRDGTEAAAVTAVMMKATSIPDRNKVKKVYLTRPFIYAIIEKQTGIPLFIGAVNEVTR